MAGRQGSTLGQLSLLRSPGGSQRRLRRKLRLLQPWSSRYLCRNQGRKGPDWLLGTSDLGFCKILGTLVVEKVCFAALFRIRHDPLKLYYVRLFFTFTQEKVNFDSKEKLMCLRSFGKPVSSVRGRAVGGGHRAIRHRRQQPPRLHNVPPSTQWCV